MKRSKTIEVSIKEVKEKFTDKLNINNSRYYSEFPKDNNIKTSLNLVKKKYCLLVKRENSIEDSITRKNSNLFIDYSHLDKKKDEEFLGEFNRSLSKFSFKSNGTNSNFKENNYTAREDKTSFYKNIHSQTPKVVTSGSSISEIMYQKNKQKKLSSRNNSYLNISVNNDIVFGRDKSKLIKNSNLTKEITFNEMPNSKITPDFENDGNFNYYSVNLKNPSISDFKNYHADLSSNDIHLSNQNMIRRKYTNKKIPIKKSSNNLEKKRHELVTGSGKISPDILNVSANKKLSNLMLSKFNESKINMSNLISNKVNDNNDFLQNNIKAAMNKIRILVVDDEKLIRQSNINLIRKFFKNKNIDFQVFECEDGFDCLSYIYQGKLVGIDFDFIITDQTMNYITGTLLSEIVGLLIEHKIIKEIKIFLVTSYSANLFDKQKNIINKVFSKPFRMEHLDFIFKNLINE